MIDWVDTLFTFTLVTNIPCGQGLNRDYVFIKMALITKIARGWIIYQMLIKCGGYRLSKKRESLVSYSHFSFLS